MSGFSNDASLNDLVKAWKESPYPSIKMSAYFPVYTELFKSLRGTSCTFIETGILHGGSLFMWRNWLGPKARIIGIDLNPEARKWESHGFEIFIGDQGSPDFWEETLAKIGAFDALLDDGGHQSFQQIVTVRGAIANARGPCTIVVEDTAASFMNDFSAHGGHTFLEYSKDATDLITGRSFGMYPPARFPENINHRVVDEFKNVFSIQFFNGIVAFKIDKSLCPISKLVRNSQPTAPVSDFRYEGLNCAEVDWPSLFEDKKIVVQGGQS